MLDNFDEKVSFSYFFPYGICSPSAFGLGIRMLPVSFVDYDPNMSMDERLSLFLRNRNTVSKEITNLIKAGYIEDVTIKYRTEHWAKFHMLRLTRSGLYLLTNTPNAELERERLSKIVPNTPRKKTAMTLSKKAPNDVMLQNGIFNVLRNEGASEFQKNTVRSILEKDIFDGKLSVLSWDPVTAGSLSVLSPRWNGERLYRALRQTNIHALFIANDFLTFMDRRPMDTKWIISQYDSLDAVRESLDAGTLELHGYLHAVLTNWYKEHPTAFSFLLPSENLYAYSEEEYHCIPSYYDAHEISYFFAQNENQNINALTGQKNILQHSFSGVAVGKKCSYIVHHTRIKSTPWIERMEVQTIAIVTRFLQDNYPDYTERENQDARSCLMVCSSVHQFQALFEDAQKYMQNKYRRTNIVGMPYTGFYILPVNESGAMQLRGFMNVLPSQFEESIIESLLQKDSRFEQNMDTVFPLTFKKKSDGVTKKIPVLVAHSMNFQTLYWAWEEHKEREYLISCYPGQVAFLKHLLPGHDFL